MEAIDDPAVKLATTLRQIHQRMVVDFQTLSAQWASVFDGVAEQFAKLRIAQSMDFAESMRSYLYQISSETQKLRETLDTSVLSQLSSTIRQSFARSNDPFNDTESGDLERIFIDIEKLREDLKIPALRASSETLRQALSHFDAPFDTKVMQRVLEDMSLSLPNGSLKALTRRLEAEHIVEVIDEGRGRSATMLRLNPKYLTEAA